MLLFLVRPPAHVRYAQRGGPAKKKQNGGRGGEYRAEMRCLLCARDSTSCTVDDDHEVEKDERAFVVFWSKRDKQYVGLCGACVRDDAAEYCREYHSFS